MCGCCSLPGLSQERCVVLSAPRPRAVLLFASGAWFNPFVGVAPISSSNHLHCGRAGGGRGCGGGLGAPRHAAPPAARRSHKPNVRLVQVRACALALVLHRGETSVAVGCCTWCGPSLGLSSAVALCSRQRTRTDVPARMRQRRRRRQERSRGVRGLLQPSKPRPTQRGWGGAAGVWGSRRATKQARLPARGSRCGAGQAGMVWCGAARGAFSSCRPATRRRTPGAAAPRGARRAAPR